MVNFPSPGLQFVDERGEVIQVLDVGTGDDDHAVVEICSVSRVGKLIGPHRLIPVEDWPRFSQGMRRVD